MFIFAGVGAASADNFAGEINAKNYGSGQHVIYELNVGSYTSEGTFKAAQAKLSELKSLGVDIVWIMPIYPRGGGIDSPYAATDYKAINPAYGSVADLRNYVSAAHALGMQVWLDWVPNHMATNATWVTTHPEYYSRDNSGNMIHPNGYGDVYELNYNNQRLVDAMNDCLKYWIDQADIDGYRCDYVSSPTIPVSYWQNTIPMLKNYKAGKTITMLAEADFSDITRLQTSGFDYDYAWGFQETRLQNGFGTSDNTASLKNYAQSFVNASKNLGVSRMVYLTNHDQNYNPEKKTLRQKYGANKYLLTVLTYTLYGMPLIYNGEETGGEQALSYFKDDKIDWSQTDAKMKNTIQVLGALKHSQAALHDGKTAADNADVTFLSTTNNNQNILAYSRKSGDSEVIVILNPSNSAQTVLIPNIKGDYSLWLNSATIGSSISRKDYNFTSSLSTSVPAKGYLVYVKGKYGDSSETVDDGVKVIDNLTDDKENSVFYESDVANADVHAWLYNDAEGLPGNAYASQGWPGDAMTMIGKTPEGKYIYKLSFDLKSNPLPANVIITENGSDDAHKVVDGAVFENHGYYVKGQKTSSKTVPYVDTSVITNLTDDTPLSIFYESDLADATVKAWFYNGTYDGSNYDSTGGDFFSRDAFTYIGKTPEGKYIYKLVLPTLKDGVPEPSNVIISENGDEEDAAHRPCGDAVFVNHGYYVKGQTASTKTVPYVTTTGIGKISVNKATVNDNRYYDLSGRAISKPLFGVYIHNGKKYISK